VPGEVAGPQVAAKPALVTAHRTTIAQETTLTQRLKNAAHHIKQPTEFQVYAYQRLVWDGYCRVNG
jgi:hypothetical protein